MLNAGARAPSDGTLLGTVQSHPVGNASNPMVDAVTNAAAAAQRSFNRRLGRGHLAAKAKQPQRHSPANRGIAMVESLVGILIFTVGILGIVGLQAAMTRAQGLAKVRADAALLANELVGMMWADSANTLSANLSSYHTGCSSGSCGQWVTRVAQALPGGTAVIETDANTGSVTINISWTSPGDGTHTYVTNTSIR